MIQALHLGAGDDHRARRDAGAVSIMMRKDRKAILEKAGIKGPGPLHL